MPITSINRYFVGDPNIVAIVTTDNLSEITADGYVESQRDFIFDIQHGEFQWLPTDIVLINYSPDITAFFTYDIDTDSFQPNTSDGGVVLPTVTNGIAHFIDTLGQISSGPANVTNDGNITAQGDIIAEGNVYAGESGTAGILSSFPSAASSGRLNVSATTNSAGNFNTTITNAASVSQNQVIRIPDSGGSSANFLIDSGPSSITSDNQMFAPLSAFQSLNPATWEYQRTANGAWGIIKTSNSLEAYGVDLTHQIRTQASKGFRLDRIEIVYTISTVNLAAHSIQLYLTNFTVFQPPNVTTLALSSTLLNTSAAIFPQCYVNNIQVNSAAFNNLNTSKIMAQVTVDNTAGAVYVFYGMNLIFSQTTP